MIPLFIILFVTTSMAFIIEGATTALSTMKEVNKPCDVCDSSHPDC